MYLNGRILAISFPFLSQFVKAASVASMIFFDMELYAEDSAFAAIDTKMKLEIENN